ncbi:hypothetical protein Vretimale_12591, partial [Volvox reticuliferus]
LYLAMGVGFVLHLNLDSWIASVKDAPPRVISVLVQQKGPFYPRCSVQEAEQFVSQRVDSGLWSRLFRYQKEGVVAGARFGGRVLLADEMGLGKTVQALTLMSCYPEDWPLLVVCPTSLRHTWVMAIQTWIPPHLRPADCDLWLITASADWDRLATEAGVALGPGDTAAGSCNVTTIPGDYSRGAGRPHIAVVSYDLAAKMSPEQAARYHSVICDESHMLKSCTTLRYRRMVPLLQRAARVVMATGTPLLNRPIEIWSQVNLLRPGLLGSFKEFGERYCLSAQAFIARRQQQQQQQQGGPGPSSGGPWQPMGSEYRGALNTGELHLLLGECVMVRRLKRNVLADLPPKIRSKVILQPNDKDLKPVTEAMQQLRRVDLARERGEISAAEAEVLRKQAWGAAYRATGPAKVSEAAAFIDRLLHVEDDVDGEEAGAASSDVSQGHESETVVEADGAKLLVFAHHQEVLNRLGEHLKQRRIKFIRIDGSVPPVRREAAVGEFQSPGPNSPRVALLALHAAGAGLTLTAATVVVFAELDQTPALLAQAEDRAHRVGQSGHVHVYYLMGRGTLDERIWRMLENKHFVMGAALDAETEQQQQQQPPAALGGAAGDNAIGYTGSLPRAAAGTAWCSQPGLSGNDGSSSSDGGCGGGASDAYGGGGTPRISSPQAKRHRPLWACALADDEEEVGTGAAGRRLPPSPVANLQAAFNVVQARSQVPGSGPQLQAHALQQPSSSSPQRRQQQPAASDYSVHGDGIESGMGLVFWRPAFGLSQPLQHVAGTDADRATRPSGSNGDEPKTNGMGNNTQVGSKLAAWDHSQHPQTGFGSVLETGGTSGSGDSEGLIPGGKMSESGSRARAGVLLEDDFTADGEVADGGGPSQRSTSNPVAAGTPTYARLGSFLPCQKSASASAAEAAGESYHAQDGADGGAGGDDTVVAAVSRTPCYGEAYSGGTARGCTVMVDLSHSDREAEDGEGPGANLPMKKPRRGEGPKGRHGAGGNTVVVAFTVKTFKDLSAARSRPIKTSPL